MTCINNSVNRKAGFDVRDLSGYRVVPDRFGMFELRITGVATFSYNSQTERHDRPDHVSDYCWSVHNTPKSAVAKAHWHSKWVKNYLANIDSDPAFGRLEA